MAMSFALSQLKDRPAFARRLLVRRPALLWMSVVAILAAVPPFYGISTDQAGVGWVGLAAALMTTDLALLALIARRGTLRSRADVVATFLFFAVLSAFAIPVLVAIGISLSGPASGPAPLDFLGQGALPMAVPTALLLLLPYAVVMGLLAGWLAFVEVTDPPSAA